MPVETIKKIYNEYLPDFFDDSKSIGIVLFAVTIISLILSNTGFGEAYQFFFTREYHIFETVHLPHSIGHWINDGLMAIFFFLVGLEIKREITTGELKTFKQAVLPVGAAVGGIVVPAFIFIVFNRGTNYSNGWGIPLATDIAFSLGIAAMLGKKFPQELKIFLMALAIIDDLGAILVIAFFYGGNIGGWWLSGAGVCLFLLWILNYRDLTFGWLHIILGILLWYMIYNSGIHATLAGVLFAFMIPREQINHIEHLIHKPVNFLVLPIFGIANTAIIINPEVFDHLFGPLGIGIFLGLFFGKPIGILLASWIMVRNKIATLPHNTNWLQLTSVGILAGIGFTMSIFIASLAFDDKLFQDISKLVILIAAVLSVIAVVVWTYFSQRKTVSKGR